MRGYLAERVCQPVQLVVAGDYPIDAEIAGACGAGPLVTLLREYANWWLRAITRSTPRLLGHVCVVTLLYAELYNLWLHSITRLTGRESWGMCAWVTLAERVCQPVPTVVAGGYPIDAEITGACGAGPLVTLLREFANLCQRWLRAITQFNLSKHW